MITVAGNSLIFHTKIETENIPPERSNDKSLLATFTQITKRRNCGKQFPMAGNRYDVSGSEIIRQLICKGVNLKMGLRR